MSDVTVAPDASPAPAAPSPAPSNEAVVNTTPTQTPTPIGSQAPEKAPGDRRDAIQKAFERASNPAKAKEDREKQQAKKPAEREKPGPGHNQPPEETKKEELNLKKAPPKGEQPRENGRFVRAAETPGQQQGQPGQPGTQPQGQQTARQAEAARLPETAPYRDPPPRMAEHAKGEWATTPERVRGEFHRLAQETEGMHKAYRADYETMETIRPYHELAQQHGTTLDRALNNYTSMERKLRSDPVGGLDVIVNNLNLRTSDGQKITLRDVAYHVLSQSPEQLKQIQQGNQQQAASHQIGALHEEVVGLKNALHQMHTQQQFSYTRSEVDQFADAHPRFDELGVAIHREINLGFSLEEAYQRADKLYPSHAAQTRTQPAQTRTSDKSISGAPESSPSNGPATRKKSEKPVERRDAINNAIRRVNGGL
jgi:hypothetical protein